MSMYDSRERYNLIRRQIELTEKGIIPHSPSEDLLEAFMTMHHFSVSRDERKFDILLIDNKEQKIYTYPMAIEGGKQWALKTMCLIVSLRNFKKTCLEEKDFRKRRKIYSKMNCIKGELNRYEMS